MNLINYIKNKIRFGNRKTLGVYFRDKKIEDSKKDSSYPTKEEFEEHKKQIQESELKSDRFKMIEEFIREYHQRENLELEYKLFEIINYNDIDINIITDENKRKYRLKKYNELKSFLNTLTKEQINSNLYLKAALTFMETGIEDCDMIIKQLIEMISHFELTEKDEKVELEVEIPTERLELLPVRINQEVGIPYYRPNAYKTECVNILDVSHKPIYDKYNSYVDKINLLATKIYALKMNSLLPSDSIQIYNYYFNILNNELEHKFIAFYFVAKHKDNITQDDEKSYQISAKAKENISRAIGLPFDKIINMDHEELEKYIEQKNGKKLTYDLRMRIDGIPIGKEHIITIEEVDKELDENNCAPKLTLRKSKNSNKE